jgi:hypothetical protein
MLGYRNVKFDDPVLRDRIKEIAQIRVLYGFAAKAGTTTTSAFGASTAKKT